jgi:hypothetical protein
MCAINVKQCILNGKYNNSLTFIAQKTADETPLILCHKNKIRFGIGISFTIFSVFVVWKN